MEFGFGNSLTLDMSFGFRKFSQRILNPQEIFGANLYDWWDATDDATLTKSGTRVLNVASKATGSTRSLSASLATAPQVITNQVNGLQVLRFDGISEFMEVAASTALYNFLHNSTGGVVISVYKPDVNGVAGRILNNRGTSAVETASGIQVARSSLDNALCVILNNQVNGIVSLTSTSNGSVINNFNLVISIFDASNATLDQRGAIILNGGTAVNNNTDNASLSNTDADYNMTVGRRVRLNDQYLKGDIPEICIVQGQATPTQLTQINAYFVNKYGTFPI